MKNKRVNVGCKKGREILFSPGNKLFLFHAAALSCLVCFHFPALTETNGLSLCSLIRAAAAPQCLAAGLQRPFLISPSTHEDLLTFSLFLHSICIILFDIFGYPVCFCLIVLIFVLFFFCLNFQFVSSSLCNFNAKMNPCFQTSGNYY